MSTLHKNIADSQRHEPKGISAASDGEVYVADGVGGGVWQSERALIKNRNLVPLVVELSDISTPTSHWVVNPILGDIYKVYTVIEGAITVADAGITLEIATVPVTGGAITIAYTGSAAGDVDSCTPSALNTVAAGQAIEIVLDGNSSTACRCTMTILMDVS